MNSFLGIIVSCILFVSCNSNKKVESLNDNETKTTIEKTYLEKYFNLSEGRKRYGAYEFDEQDINQQIHLFNVNLPKAGYKFVSDDIFFKKINDIFQVKLPQSFEKASIIDHTNFFIVVAENFDHLYLEGFTDKELQEKEIQYYKEDQYSPTAKSEYENIVFVKNKNYIMPALAPFKFTKRNGTDFKVEIPDYIVHRNKFLFNDSNASLTWLINNDLLFLTQLITRFNYDENDKMNKAVLEGILKDYLKKQTGQKIALVDLFARKDYNDIMHINKNLMKFVSENYNKQEGTPIELLNAYAYIICDIESDYNFLIVEKFTKEERLELAAYAGYYEQISRFRNGLDGVSTSYYTHYEGWDSGGFLRNTLVSNKELLESIKKNNYYNLPDFQEMVENILAQIELQTEEYNRTHNFDNKTMQELLS